MKIPNPIFAVVAAAAIVGAGAASAADLPVRTYTKAPVVVPAPVYNWTGFYVGGNIGGAWGSQADSAAADGAWLGFAGGAFVPYIPSVASPTLRSSSFTGGMQAGWNYQAGNLLAGIEADGRWMSLKKTNNTGYIADPEFAANSEFIQSGATTWISTVRGRLGYAANNWLFYGTGGVAFGNVQSNYYYNRISSGYVSTGGVNQTETGWTAGGGVEWGFASNWSAKVEYLHVDIGKVSYRTFSNNFPAFFEDPTARTRADLVTVGVNYRFGGPVVAKY